MKYGVMTVGHPDAVVRFSSAIRRMKEHGMSAEAIAEVERVRDQYRTCPTHGFLEDPIIGIVGQQIAVCCPWCSGQEALALWEAEGRKGVA